VTWQDDTPKGELILYETEDGRTRIDCRFEGETIWLTQALMAELFQTTLQNINLHLQNTYEEGELDPGANYQVLLDGSTGGDAAGPASRAARLAGGDPRRRFPLPPGFAIMNAMSERARKLLHDAMDLPVSERAELAADLLASLDGEPGADVEAAWASEIERRAREALANPDDDVAWETVRAELHAAPTR